MIYLLKACKKCGGDLFEQGDSYGSYFSCFQCGTIYEAKIYPVFTSEKQRLRDPGRQNFGIPESEALK